MPLLSIIIPVYNSGKYLSRCLDSIVNQTFTYWELILVNDGSTDNSLDICNQYKRNDSRIIVIDKDNEGAGPTRNVGINTATGKYLAFPDSDDRMDTNAYAECIRIMEEEDCDLLVFGMKTEIFDDDSETVIKTVEDNIPSIQIGNRERFRNQFVNLYESMDLGSPCNKIYKKQIIDDNHVYYPDLRRMQDCVFNLYYFEHVNSFCSINKNFFIRTWHSEEFQRKKMPRDFINCAITHYQTLIEMTERWGINSKECRAFFGDRFSEVIMTAEFSYLPSQKPTLIELYRHIKHINKNTYIHGFYKVLKRLKKLRKKEIAMLYNLNVLLSIESYIKLKP